jgi:hypothetical protein
MSVVTLCNAGCRVTFDNIGVIVTHSGKIVMEGEKCTNTGLWMGPITNKANSQEFTNYVANIAPTSTNIGNQQVNNNMTTYFGDKTYFIANAIQKSFKDELANYHHR